ncbi:MAG: hypothetical protein AB1610_03290 [Nitrospirota bacterium]
MKDRYFLKKEKVANLMFDLVKYLLTTLGAILLLSEKTINIFAVVITVVIAIIIFITAFVITPLKEDG